VTDTQSGISRRALLGGAAAVAGAAALAPLEALAARSATATGQDREARRSFSPDYGPLSPVRDHTTGLELLLLPEASSTSATAGPATR
jgi:hypothetical protein